MGAAAQIWISWEQLGSLLLIRSCIFYRSYYTVSPLGQSPATWIMKYYCLFGSESTYFFSIILQNVSTVFYLSRSYDYSEVILSTKCCSNVKNFILSTRCSLAIMLFKTLSGSNRITWVLSTAQSDTNVNFLVGSKIHWLFIYNLSTAWSA
jgi:hypothetical protein